LFNFFSDRGELNLTYGDWVENITEEVYEGMNVIMTFEMFAELQIKDNPFIKVSPTTKYVKLIEQTETKFHVRIISKCSGVPYCDTFSIEEDFLILSPSPTAAASILRIQCQVIFHKSTIFKSKI
jgi:hypothetical protein